MKRIVLVAALALGIGGCGLVESAFGIQRDPVTGETVSDGTGGVVGTAVNYFIPGLGAVVISLAGAYAEAKRRQWKNAALSTMKGIEDFAETEVGKPIADKFKAKLAEHHIADKAFKFVKGVLDNQGINKPATNGG